MKTLKEGGVSSVRNWNSYILAQNILYNINIRRYINTKYMFAYKILPILRNHVPKYFVVLRNSRQDMQWEKCRIDISV